MNKELEERQAFFLECASCGAELAIDEAINTTCLKCGREVK